MNDGDRWDKAFFQGGIDAMRCPACGAVFGLARVDENSFAMKDHPCNLRHVDDADFWVCPDATTRVFGGRNFTIKGLV
jgi:uncharacterized C2H2 Zn-finger protein